MLDLGAVLAARERIKGRVHHTPLFSSRILSERTGSSLSLKCECFQKTGSFKARGALNKVLTLSEGERDAGLITVSAGNHAAAVAWAASQVGAPCVVVMPTDAPRSKVDAVRSYGGEVVTHDDRATLFDKLAEERDARGMVFVHPFDDPAVLEVGARVHNRAMARFCADDSRMHAVGYLPLSLGPEVAGQLLDEAFADGVATVMVDTNEPNPDARSFTHPNFDPVWARFAAANVPFVVHIAVNGHYDPVSPSFHVG